MPVDPEFMPLVARSRELPELDFENTPVDVLLAQLRSTAPAVNAPRESPVSTEDREVAGPYRNIPLRIYTPPGTGPFPILVNFHGGGWVMGTLAMDDVRNLRMAEQAGCIIVSVDYCLAPEHRFPEPLEECYAVLEWAATRGAGISGDPSRLAVAGGSAGGNLATAAALLARDRKGPRLAFQLLFYPACSPDLTTLSYKENGSGYGLTTAAMGWFWKQYLPDGEQAGAYAAPLLAPDLGGLPPALVFVAEYDPLRDEGIAYAERLRKARVPTELQLCEGMLHGFLSSTPTARRSQEVIDAASKALQLALKYRRLPGGS